MRDTPIIFAFEIMGDGAGREIFGDEAAFEAHKAAPHYYEFNHAIDSMVIKKSVRFLQNISHHA